MTSGVYLITVKPTQELYVGSSLDIKKRKAGHWSICRSCYKCKAVPRSVSAKAGLYLAAVKYNPDTDFDFRVIEELPADGRILAERERFWFQLLNPTLNVRTKISRRDQGKL